jgi:hypothetical protein
LLSEDDGSSVVKTDADALASITKSEVGMQLDAAHRWPRSIERFMTDATYLVTMSKETAKSCIYSLPVRKGGDKPIAGPSVRLAEMCATSWGNLHTGARIIDVGKRDVTAQALAWDLEKNLRLSIEVKRGIVTSDGRTYGDDMIRVTSMAAISIALRNAIFRIIPRALVNNLYEVAVRKATGVADDTFEEERDAVIEFFVNKGKISIDRILSRLSIGSVGEITPDLLEVLIGIGQAWKDGQVTSEDALPAPRQPVTKATALDEMVNAGRARKSQPPPANDANEITPLKLVAALIAADGAWDLVENNVALVSAWTADQQRLAYDWATAHADPTINDADLPVRPDFTVLEPIRQPGEDG